eukprot:CAMPEP_0202724074 /NCGR_PEP_ID=MMETSP1385-20130828/170809_1 /ASSEMBLY_ACC=CAM_ASM_000861 /TAXON_ID=933848 /ORGANISM="Elphidium margaritaceum" /LENGTH=50 /DNA_ID=CAMNT_0049389535 /DNA_START=12 /DNA_END=161 /DNA_ORIENTATION=-
MQTITQSRRNLERTVEPNPLRVPQHSGQLTVCKELERVVTARPEVHRALK